MSNSDNFSVEELEQSLLETMAKHLIKDLNRLINANADPIESDAKKQRKLLLNILLENNLESIEKAHTLDNYLRGKNIDKYFEALSSMSLQSTVSKLTLTIENSKKLLKNFQLKKKTQTISQALSNQETSIMTEVGHSISNKDICEIKVKNEPQIIDISNQEIVEPQSFFAPNPVPQLLPTFDQTISFKNESINELNLNIDEKNFVLNESKDMFQQINSVSNQRSVNRNDVALNPTDCNIDSRSLTLMNTTNQANFLDEADLSLNKFEQNIDIKSDTLLNPNNLNDSTLNANASRQDISTSTSNVLDLNIDSRLGNITGLQNSVNQTKSSTESESIKKHEPQIDIKSVSLLDLSQQNTSNIYATSKQKNTDFNETASNQNTSVSKNVHELNIDSRLGNITGLQNSFNQTNNLIASDIIIAHERNIDTKCTSLLDLNNTKSNVSGPNISFSLNAQDLNIDSRFENMSGLHNSVNHNNSSIKSETINPHEQNIDSKSNTILNLSKKNNSEIPLTSNPSQVNENNTTLKNTKSTKNIPKISHQINKDSRLGSVNDFQNSLNQTQDPIKSETISAHERNIDIKSTSILNNLSQSTTLGDITGSSLNKLEVNIDSKRENSILLNQKSSEESKKFDFSDVNKLMNIVKTLPIDMTMLKSLSLPKIEAKRELNRMESNTSEAKRLKSEKSNLLNESKYLNYSQVEKKHFNNKVSTSYQGGVKQPPPPPNNLDRDNHTYHCSFVDKKGIKCTFKTPYIRHFKKHLKNQKHDEQENLSQAGMLSNTQNIESSYYTSILPASNNFGNNNNKNLRSTQYAQNNRVNSYQNSQQKCNDRGSNSIASAANMGVYY